jgi:transposase-like protein
VLLAAEGIQNKAIAERLGIGRAQAARWRTRYAEHGINGIERDRPRGAPPQKMSEKKLKQLAELAPILSTREMGTALGVSASTVTRHLRIQGLRANPRQRQVKIHEEQDNASKISAHRAVPFMEPEALLKYCERLVYQGVSISDLKQRIQSVRSGLDWRFKAVGKSFAAYLARVARNELQSRGDGTRSLELENLRVVLIEDFPVTDDLPLDIDRRRAFVNACIHLVRAEQATQEKLNEVAWYFLSEATWNLGYAERYYDATFPAHQSRARATRAQKIKAEKAKEHERKLYIRLLTTRAPQEGWKSESDAVKEVSREAEPILKIFNVAVADPHRNLYEMLKTQKDVQAAFEKVKRRKS